jgi:hypothetical protein
MPEYTSWMGTPHAKTTEAAKAAPTFADACLACHGPDAATGLAGVQCEVCHGAGSDYWPIPVMMDKAKAVAKGLLIPEQGQCDRCHDGADHRNKVKLGDYHHTHRAKHEAHDSGGNR